VGKLKSDQKGFSAVEGLLVVLILVVIGAVGYMVYHNNHKTKASVSTTASTKPASTAKTTTPPDPYAGWQSYSDSHVSFKYPSGWQIGNGDKYATVGIGVTSPNFTSTAFTTADNAGAPVALFLQVSTNGSTVYCSNDPCTVTAVTPLNNTQLPNSALAIVNQTRGNGTNYSQYVVVSSSTKVGDTTINALKGGTDGIYLFGQPDYTPKDGGLSEAARVSNATTLQADSNFKNLANLINSVKFN
jgi:hypothetical protein